jgi:hypothetical protein
MMGAGVFGKGVGEALTAWAGRGGGSSYARKRTMTRLANYNKSKFGWGDEAAAGSDRRWLRSMGPEAEEGKWRVMDPSSPLPKRKGGRIQTGRVKAPENFRFGLSDNGTVRPPSSPYRHGQNVNGDRPLGPGSVGGASVASKGKFDMKALMGYAGEGALAGAVVGGLNPMGDDGMLRGAAKGAVLGGLTGGAAGYRGKDMFKIASKGNHAGFIGGGRVAYAYGTDPATALGMSASIATLGGVAGGLIGGSGRKKRNTVIQSNSWSQGTHPQYYGG